ncbi:hypothetical protein KC340_g16300 [Hortaea werneckii]|nr:hypothetical protein KC342_g16616 [Hortaea werneckii]KAI7060198.1 hypothetical protein KC339_g17187 [Hortaea werneckii]KAI7211344.1 hypothetical protein KC365_g14993 [Hortaea werneckii]KAI7294062.1 hypothetical protein KC340_g16300 [Hortaea werneckii]KAI7379263.1 hypothetical protein KC328_g13437 [Hortaea werneckii]
MVVHHIIPERLRDQIRNCGCCGRLFTTATELEKHVGLTRFCEVSPESRAKWDVLPPTSRQQRADTWCYEEDGTPSDDVLVPNPSYTADSKSELRLPRKRCKRKAADEQDWDFAAGQKKACRRETLESDRVVVDLCAPPTAPVQPPKSRDVPSIADQSLATESQSIHSLEASLQTTLQTFFPFQGIDLHNHTPNPISQLQQPPVPPDPSVFFEYTGNRSKPYVPGNLPSLHGTDAQLARSNNLPLLTSGFASHGAPPSVDPTSQPPDRVLVGPVKESLNLARRHYVHLDFQQSTLAGTKGAAEAYQRCQLRQQQQQQQWVCATPSRPPFIHPTPAKISYPPCAVGYAALQPPPPPPPPPPPRSQRRPQQQGQQQQQQQQQLMHTGFPPHPQPSRPLHHDGTQGIQFLPMGSHLLSSVQSHPHPYPLLWQGVS